MIYEPLTAVNRIKKTEIDPILDIGGHQIVLPHKIRQSSEHVLVDAEGKGVEAAYITMPLAHLLNAYRLRDLSTRKAELKRAIKETDDVISELIKSDVLRKKHRGGAMSFSQAHENVPEECLMISERTFKALVAQDDRWQRTSHVYCIRFPNLGPQTTIRLRLMVDSQPLRPDTSELPEEAQSTLLTLRSLLGDDTPAEKAVMEAFYLNPKVLKDCLEGDGDGDLVYCVRAGWGRPWFKELERARKPGAIDPSEVQKMLKKAARQAKEPVSRYLPNYFDDTPIGQATYAIRWKLFQDLQTNPEPRPMHSSWKKVSPWALQLIEFVMDIRKGEFSEQQIYQKMSEIRKYTKQLAAASAAGNWFAKSVTTGKIQDVEGFLKQFPTLSDFCNHVSGQKEVLDQ